MVCVFVCFFSVQEESLKVRAETKLDINLESSRISDMVCVCVVTLTHKPVIQIYVMFYSAVGVGLKGSTGAAETQCDTMIVSAAAEAHFCVLLSVH